MATLNQMTNTLLKARNRNGVAILSHIHNIVQHMAKEHDWDAAARLLQATNKDNANDNNVNRTLRSCLRAYFGERLILKTDKTHDTGYKFVFGIDCKWPEGTVAPCNTGEYDVVLRAVENGVSMDNAGFQRDLREAIKTQKDEPTEEKKRAALRTKAENLAKSLIKAGIEPSLFTSMFNAEVKALKAKQVEIAKQVITLDPVIEEPAAVVEEKEKVPA
jgi:hypothetical protein